MAREWLARLVTQVGTSCRSVDDTVADGGEKVESVEFSVGLLLIVGFKYFFTSNWAIELELGYELAPKSTTIEHAFADS